MSIRGPVVVVLAADSMFTKQLAAAIASIQKSATREHQVYVLHDAYEPALIEQISGIAGDLVSLHWLDARSSTLDDAQLPPYLSTATLFRLRIGKLLPDDIERVLYIDSDVAVRSPLDELWETDLNGCVLAAVRDPVVPWAAAPAGLPWEELGVDPDTPYFNAGVLVIDAGLWRSQHISEDALQFLARHRFLYADQCALNTVLAGRWTRIGPHWNLQAGHLVSGDSLAWVIESRDTLTAAIDNPAIVHFNNSAMRRPWDFKCTHPYRDLWFEFLDLTPWEGWRPAAPSRARRIAGRIRKAGEVLVGG